MTIFKKKNVQLHKNHLYITTVDKQQFINSTGSRVLRAQDANQIKDNVQEINKI